MHSVQAGMWDPRPPSKHASPLPLQPTSNSRHAHVTTATPAKRITFYKSGDSQFGGIRMAVHKRSFKCFDALLDDLSQKVPLPFGVRTVTTPRGIHTIKHLEQLQDGGCYLCSDRRQAKPVNLELAGKRPSIWYHHSRRPQRPETTTPPGHLPYRQRRILLVKNSEPGMRRSVVLSRRSTRSLRAFLDEVSDVMQFHVRKLYTAEGRRIDSVQSLMTCPGVLVCVGREAFSPVLINFIRKSSEEKLPGLGSRSPGLGPRTPGNGARSPITQGARSPPHGAQSRASEYSEGHESKKNVNFGLETKKSIIHPRSDSSNRSARFSLSSEKSYGNGVSAYPQSRPGIANEDIEKRVLVNKDGSLSVEMRVRFRLHNDETLQWSTQIKKSPSLSNECCPLSQDQPHYLQQGQSESCSDPDSTSYDPECVDYSSQPLQQASEVNHCPCCYQRQEQQYDLWENPAHSNKKPPVPPPLTSSHTHTMVRHTHSSSSSSSCNSRRVVRCRARMSSCGGGSGSEQSQLVQEEMCVTEQVERRVEVEQDRDTHVEVRRVSRCCSRSEVVTVDSNQRPLSQKSVDELMMEEEGERPLSAISSSSRVLQSLKEDPDDGDDLPPSASQCCHRNESSPTSQSHLNDKPTTDASDCSIQSAEEEKHEEEEGEGGSRPVSATSSCHCRTATPHSTAQTEEPKISRASGRSSKAKTPNSEEEGAADDEDEEMKRVVSGLSGDIRHSAGSQQSRASSVCPNCGGCKRGVNSVSTSRASTRSHHSHQTSPKPATPLSNKQENASNGSDDDGSDGSAGSAVSTQSNKTNLTNHGRFSAMSNVLEDRASSAMSDPEAAGKSEERPNSATSGTSHRSSRSHKSGCKGVIAEKEERSPSAVSTRSNQSAKSNKSHKSTCSGTAEAPDIRTREEAEGENAVERALSSMSAKSGASSKPRASVKLSVKAPSATDNTAVEEDDSSRKTPGGLSVKSNASHKSGKTDRPDSGLSAKSAKSNVSAKSRTSHRSTCSHCVRAVSPGAKTAEPVEATGQEEEMEEEARPASAMSAKSNQSAKSNKSHKSTQASERSCSPRSAAEGVEEDRAESQMSGRSVKSDKSVKSSKSNCKGNEIAESADSKDAEEKESETLEKEENQRPESASRENEERAASALSGKSAASAKSRHTNGDTSSRVASPAKKTEVDKLEDRTPSVMSGKSSAKSSKSQKSNRTATSPSPNEADVPSIDTKKQNQERVGSAMSVKSNSSVKSSTSHKSISSRTPTKSPSPNVTIKTAKGADKEENKTSERAPSAASAKSGRSNASSHTSKNNVRTDITVSETPDADGNVTDNTATRGKSPVNGEMLSPKRTRSPQTHSPKTPATPPSSPQSPGQHLLPGPNANAGETRGPSALSVLSTTSAKSGRSKCNCGSASALDKAKKEKEVEDKDIENKEDNEELGNEKTSERAASILSSPTRRQRKESGGTEQPLSRNSSGSVSLGLPEDHETADSDSGKSSVSCHRNTKSQVKTSTPDVSNSAEITMKSNSNGSKSTMSNNPPAIDIPIIETPGDSEEKGEEAGEQQTERAGSPFSAKSNRSHKSACNCSVKSAAQHASASPTKAENDLESQSVKSASTTKASNAADKRTSSAMSSASAKVRSKSPASASIKNANVAEDSTNNDSEHDRDSKAGSVHSKSPCCLRPESTASGRSESKMKASKESKEESGIKSDSSNSVRGDKAKSKGSASSSQKKETPVKSSSPCPLHSSKPNSKMETGSESTLSHSLSAADLLKETLAAARSHSRQSKASKTSEKPRSEKSGRCQRSRNQMDQEDVRDLIPACLPNASPNEVVSDWLRSIPANSSMLALGDELQEEEEQQGVVEEKPDDEVAKEDEGAEDEKVEMVEKVEAEEKEKEDGGCEEAGEKSPDPGPGDAAETRPNTLNTLSSGESLHRSWNSSAAVMKVLLNSSLGRCHSMPEVSPVYGRRLSTSARGLLDCLAQLQLIEPAVSPGQGQQYEDIMTILQSLWLTRPLPSDDKDAKDTGTAQVTPPRSSSGVDMSSGSGGSGKENGDQGGDDTKQSTEKETESLQEDEAVERVEEEEREGDAETEHKETEAEPEETTPEQEETDTPEEPVKSEEQSTVPQSLDSPKATESSKSLPENEQDTPEDCSSDTPPTVVRAPLSKKPSQDPDPVWVLHLLKKLEKQFMSHYINAMAEFKVRWDLDDSLILDTMICELRDEVSRRIQNSIKREMSKIQSRAGRGGRSPRPPQGETLSRDSTMTEKRRRMLKVMKNQSVKTADSLSDGEMTGEFSDQRSEDEYCPCDACVRKKMAARPLKAKPVATDAPVMKEFDLLKILQLKKSPSPLSAPAPEPQPAEEGNNEDARNLEVLEEEEEEDETKEDIKANVVLEETIPEEDEEVEEEGDEAKGEEEGVDDEEEKAGVGSEETGEEKTSENEEEEEETTVCQCQCGTNEEESDKTEEEGEGEAAGEDEEGAGDEEKESAEDDGEKGGNEEETGSEEEEESDRETVKEASAGEGGTTEDGEGKEEAEEEACEVCEFKPEEDEEETTGKESGEEASGESEDDGAAKNAAAEESTQVEEFVEGGDEDDGAKEDAKGGGSEEDGGQASEEDRASPQGQGVTEGEEADAEDSDTASKRPSDTSADEGAAATGDEEEKEAGGDGGEEEAAADAVEELKPEEEEVEEENVKTTDGALLHQFTRTSVESQPGSLEDVDTDSPQIPVNSIEVPKMAAAVSAGGGAGQRRSRSPARVKRRKPKESDVEVDDF